MNKNMIKMFLLTTLILFMSLSLVSASDMVDDTNDVDVNNVKNVDKTDLESDKLSDNEINYYVSDTSGSDNNNGTNSSPFKTIQTALNKTTSTGVYNIYIKEGTYKGVGNTNLTVNGSHTINLIGDGINKTMLDGEVKYTAGSGTVWGSSGYWSAYSISYGNWGLNVTNGTGKVTISNLNIQNMVSVGAAHIGGFNTSTINNYGNLSVDNVYFYHNLAGVGAGIKNNANATLYVNNSIFEANRKSNTLGNYGGGIYNNGTATVYNTLFDENGGRWGVITNDNNLTIVNCTLKNGISYDLGSTFKMGSGIATNTGGSNYFDGYFLNGLFTNITNCTFINNGQCDIYQDTGDLYVSECEFINSTGIFINSFTNSSLVNSIIGNTFINMSPSSIFGSLSGRNSVTVAIYSQAKVKTIIENNTINSINGYAISISNATIKNNNLTNTIVALSNNTIINNTINTTSFYTINITGTNNIITNNILSANMFYGDMSINSINNNVVENNTPKSGTIINLTENNFNTYFDENGITTNNIENGSIIDIQFNIANKNLTLNNTKVALTTTQNNILYNTTLTIKQNSNTLITGITINNTNNADYTLLIEANNVLIQNSTINVNTTTPTTAIKIKGNQTTLYNNKINITAPSNQEKNTYALTIESNNNQIYNNINLTDNNSTQNTTLTGILLNNAHNNEIDTIIINGTQNTIGILSNNSNNNTIGGVNIKGVENATGILLNNSNNNTINSIGTINSINHAYGIIITGNNTKNNNITYSGTINSINSIGILAENIENTVITGTSTIKRVIGDYARAILITNSKNMTINGLSFNLTEKNNSTTQDIKAIEFSKVNNTQIVNIYSNKAILLNNSHNNTIKYVNTEVTRTYQVDDDAIILQDSHNNTIDGLTIYSNKENIITLNNSNNNQITNNYLLGNQAVGGDDTITQINSNNNTLQNNTPIVITLTNDNYNQYFTNQTLNEGILEIILGSNLYNKNLTFTYNITFKNPNNYTIYNTTITNKNATITMTNMKINTTDDRTNIINNTGYLTMNYGYLYQENKNNIAKTIINTGTINGMVSITVIAPATTNYENTTTVITSNGTMQYIKGINLTTTGTGGIVNLINSEWYVRFAQFINITVITNHNLTINSPVIGLTDSNITFVANNIKIGNDKYGGIYNIVRCNIDINANELKIEPTWTKFFESTEHNAIGIGSNNISLNTTKATNLIITNESFTSIINNTLVTNNEFQIKISNVTMVTENWGMGGGPESAWEEHSRIDDNNIITNQTTSIISLENCANFNITNNYLYTNDLKGNKAVTQINSTNLTISKNLPIGDILTDENYNEYFTNGIFTRTDVDSIELGSNIYNKNMTFNNIIILDNTNNYTIYNGTITFNAPNNTVNGIKINNTDDRKSSIIINNGTNITNFVIYQENTNNTGETIIINSEGRVYFSKNNVTTTGNNTILNIYNNFFSISQNNLNMYGDNVTAIKITNNTITGLIFLQNNNITLESSNPTTAIIIENSRMIRVMTNKIIIKAFNNETPIINLINTTNVMVQRNYIEAYDTYGQNAIKKTSGSATVSANTPTNTFNTTIKTDAPSEIYINNTITININTTDMLDRPINSGVLEVTYNNQTTNITINNSTATYTFTPIINGINTIVFTFTPTNTSYLTTNKTVNIQVNKYNTMINANSIVGKINKTISITPTIIDELLNNVTGGNITVSDENGTILANSTVTNGATNLNIKFNSTGNKTLVVTYTGTDKYEESTINITTTITKLNTTITVDNVVGVVGESITLIAHIIDEQGDNVTSGRVQFKINGVTLRDTNGSIIYVNVTNGVARLTLTAVRGWTNTNAYISANYAGNGVYLTSVSRNNSVNIAKRNATVEIISDSRIYKAGETITITAIVVDSNGELANNGQVVFKLNGVTLKDKNGKTIMINVVNGVATLTYTLPSTFADYNYTITAIFAGGDYNRQVSKNSTLQVVKTSIHMDLDPVITTTNTATIKAKIYDGNNKQITGTTRVTIKLNGVTIINSQNITNGNLQFTINTPYPRGLYNMTIIAGPSSVYEQLQRNTTLVIMKN